MRIHERIAPSSTEHYALFALDEHEARFDRGVEAVALHESTNEFFPTAQGLLDALMELATRGLVENTTDGWVTTAPGRTAINRRGRPESPPPWAEPAPPDLGETDEEREDGALPDSLDSLVPPAETWDATDHTGVYVASRMPPDAFGSAMPALIDAGAAVMDALPEGLRDEWNVILTEGPYRPYGVAYAVLSEADAIVLDAYSVRPDVRDHEGPLVRAVVRAVLEQHKWDAEGEAEDAAETGASS